jgi:uncharacterized membrane protein YeiH
MKLRVWILLLSIMITSAHIGAQKVIEIHVRERTTAYNNEDTTVSTEKYITAALIGSVTGLLCYEWDKPYKGRLIPTLINWMFFSVLRDMLVNEIPASNRRNKEELQNAACMVSWISYLVACLQKHHSRNVW